MNRRAIFVERVGDEIRAARLSSPKIHFFARERGYTQESRQMKRKYCVMFTLRAALRFVVKNQYAISALNRSFSALYDIQNTPLYEMLRR